MEDDYFDPPTDIGIVHNYGDLVEVSLNENTINSLPLKSINFNKMDLRNCSPILIQPDLKSETILISAPKTTTETTTEINLITSSENDSTKQIQKVIANMIQQVWSQVKQVFKLFTYHNLHKVKLYERSIVTTNTMDKCFQNLLIVLDLDETLVHSYFKSGQAIASEHWKFLTMLVNLETQWISQGQLNELERQFFYLNFLDQSEVIVQLRPGVRLFLHNLTLKYKVGVWSAGGTSYVQELVKILFAPIHLDYKPLFAWSHDMIHWEYSKQNLIATDFGESCPTNYSKPLQLVVSHFPQFELNNIILFDNRSENGKATPHQVISVPDFSPIPWTRELFTKLIPINDDKFALLQLSEDDKKFVGQNKYLIHSAFCNSDNYLKVFGLLQIDLSFYKFKQSKHLLLQP